MGFNYRVSSYCFDCLDFVRQNRGRLFSFVVFGIIGVMIGVWYGMVVSDEAIFFWHIQGRLLLVITDETTLIKYFFLVIIECVVLVGIIFALSMNYYLSFFNYLLFIYKGYLIAFNAVILIAAARLSCFPFLVLCYIPFSLIVLLLLASIATKLACDAYYALSSRCRLPLSETLLSLAPLLMMMLLLCLIEAILTFTLTSGIIL